MLTPRLLIIITILTLIILPDCFAEPLVGIAYYGDNPLIPGHVEPPDFSGVYSKTVLAATFPVANTGSEVGLVTFQLLNDYSAVSMTFNAKATISRNHFKMNPHTGDFFTLYFENATSFATYKLRIVMEVANKPENASSAVFDVPVNLDPNTDKTFGVGVVEGVPIPEMPAPTVVFPLLLLALMAAMSKRSKH
jgi:hypothetical protein